MLKTFLINDYNNNVIPQRRDYIRKTIISISLVARGAHRTFTLLSASSCPYEQHSRAPRKHSRAHESDVRRLTIRIG